jgi:tetratricopeptide (TPR) repeat protein
MEEIPLFNPYTMSDDQILKVQTGQDTHVKKILAAIQNNQNAFASKHIVICGPGGIGKSFLMRRLQIHFKPYSTIAFFLFPEIPAHMYCANDFLKNIQQFLLSKECENQSKPDANKWNKNSRIIDQILFESQYKHIIVGIENLHLLLSEQGIFSNSVQKNTFLDLLQNKSWLTLITTHKGNFSRELAPFFQTFSRYDLSKWSNLEHKQYLKRIFSLYQEPDTDYQKVRQNELSRFTGGLPRNAAIMANILRQNDFFSTINTLEKTIDWLTPYFQNQFFSLMPQYRILIDALICSKEPCTIKEIEHRIHLSEKEISQNLCWLREHGYLNECVQKDNTQAYSLKDRIFVHYYRKRHEFPKTHGSLLSNVSEFVTTFYSNTDLIKIARDCYTNANLSTSKDLLKIILSHAGISIDLLSCAKNLEWLFQAVDICFSDDFKFPKSEKKLAAIFQQMRDLIKACQNSPDDFDKNRFAYMITNNLFIDKKMILFLFQKCIHNQLSYNQWIDLDLFFYRQEYKIHMAYGGFLVPFLRQIKDGHIIPDEINEMRINRLKKNDPDIYYALVAFCSARFPFEITSKDQLEAHRRCLSMTQDIDFQVFHLEQIGWHLGCVKAYSEAISYFQKALTIREKQHNRLKQAWITGQIGWCHQLQKEYDDSLQYHQTACSIYNDENDIINYAWNVGCIGRIYGKLGTYETALNKHCEAIDILDKNFDIKQIAWNWSRIARNQTCLKRYDLAMNAHQTALEILENDRDHDLKAWNLEGLAWIYGKVNQHDDAIKAQQKALKYRSQEGNISQQAWNLEGIGWSLGKLGRFEEALKVLNRALKVREKSRHYKGQAWNLEGIARYLGRLARFNEAITAHENALILQEKANNYERQIWNYRGIAWNHKEMNNYDQSIHALKQALACAEKSENIYWQAALWALIGWDYHKIHSLADSIKAHEKAISFYQTLNNGAGVLENAGQMAINYFILGQTGRAWNVLDHYSDLKPSPNKMVARIGDVIIYLIRHVRQNIAYRTAVNIIDGLLLRRKNWDILPIMQAFLLSLIVADLDIKFTHRLVRYVRKRYQNNSSSHLLAIFDLVEYINQNWNTDFLNKMERNRRQAMESLIDAISNTY